jgi:Caspase domain
VTVTETGSGQPANRKLGVVILGASAYPHFPASLNLDNASFARSAAAFRGLVEDEKASLFGKPAVLNLFDADEDPASVVRRVKAFLKGEPALSDVLLYYCGHGNFLRDRTYYLTLKATEPDNEAFTGLPLRQMRLALETQLTMKRVFIVLDCCFSGQAAKEWMSAGIGLIEEQVFQSFLKRGTALIAASARSGPALAPEGEPLTMFTGALIAAISAGVAGEKRELSFRDIVDAVRARIADRYGGAGVAPEIHAPRQEEGDITFTPFFVNRAFVVPAETIAERKIFEFAVADLNGPFAETRGATVGVLDQLLSSTQSAAFRKEILNKRRAVKKNDDSDRVKKKCEEVLAPWPEPPIVVPPVKPLIVDRLVTPPEPGTRLGLWGSGSSRGGANKIEESSKPETPAKPKTLGRLLAGALLRSVGAYAGLVVIALIFGRDVS